MGSVDSPIPFDDLVKLLDSRGIPYEFEQADDGDASIVFDGRLLDDATRQTLLKAAEAAGEFP